MSVLLSGGSLSGKVNTGALIVNDYRITLEEIEGGGRLTIIRGSEIQSIDLATKSQSKILIRVENDYIQVSYNDGQTWENLIALDDIAGGVGGFYTPSIDSEGNLSWTASHEDMPVVDTVNIKGKDGYTPVKGKDYFDGKDGYTPQKNVDYFDGKDGDDGGHYAPHVDDEGNLSWIASKGDMPAIQGSNIKGTPGQDGVSGVHIGPDKPTDPAVNVWVKPDSKPSQIVMYAPQTLDDAQKDQARSNIGAASKEELSVLSEEIAELKGYDSNKYVQLGRGVDFVAIDNAPRSNYGAVTITPEPQNFALFRSKNIFGLNLPETTVHNSLKLKVTNSLIELNGTGGMAWYEINLDVPIVVKAGGWVMCCKIGGTMDNYFTMRLYNSSDQQVFRDQAFSNATEVNNDRVSEDIEITHVKLYAPEGNFSDVKVIVCFFVPQDTSPVKPEEVKDQLFDGELVTYGKQFKLQEGYNAVMAIGADSVELGYYEGEEIASDIQTTSHVLRNGVNTVAISGALGVTLTNTLESIHQSYLAGADAVELDLRLTSDNVLVLSHSHLLDNVVDVSSLGSAGSYPINDYTADVITSLPLLNYDAYFTDPVYVPLFSDALKLCKSLGLKVWIDLKTDSGTPEYAKAYTYIDAAIANVKAAGMLDSVVFINAYDSFRSYVREKLPNAWIAVKTYIGGTTVEEDIESAAALGGNVVIQMETSGASWPDGVLTAERIASYHRAGYKIGAPYVPYNGDVDYVMSTNKALISTPKMFSASISHIASEWAASNGTVSIEYSESIGANVIAVTDDRYGWNEVKRLAPRIECSSIYLNHTARARYDDGLKKIVIAVFDRNEIVDVSQYDRNNIFSLYVTF